jgi:glycerophosphoryl diester phosphodiesterase
MIPLLVGCLSTVAVHARPVANTMGIMGHRGASAIAPENTLQSVRLALQSGVGFEIDLQVSRDGQVIVLHDDTLERTAAPLPLTSSRLAGAATQRRQLIQRPVRKLDLRRIRLVSVGDNKPVPTFSEALQELRSRTGGVSSSAHCFAEVKSFGHNATSGYDPLLTKAASEAVLDAGVSPSRLTWISFSLGALLDLKRRLPKHRALLIAFAKSQEEAWAYAQQAVDAGVDGVDYHANPNVVTAELVQWLHSRGKLVAVWVWSVGSGHHDDVEPVWEHMARSGVDFFTSNLPPAIHGWRARRERPRQHAAGLVQTTRPHT